MIKNRPQADRILVARLSGTAGRLSRWGALGDAQADTGAAERPLSDNGTVVVVKEPRGAVLTPLAVPMSLAAGRQNSCNGLSAVGDLRCSRAYGAVYAGGIPYG
jgi:hypothetical protein